jgi:hypothetical protein
MTYDKLRAIILANPTEPPKSIAERCDVPAWKVKDARKGLIAIGAVPRLTAVRGPITDVDTAAMIEMRRAGHSIGAIREHFRCGYSVAFRVIEAATRAGELDPCRRITPPQPPKPVKPAKVRAAISDDERQAIIDMRRDGRTHLQIVALSGRRKGTISQILSGAIAAGELQPVKRRRREERETCRAGLGDAPAPKVRLSLNMTDEEARVVASQRALLGEKAGTALEILSSFRRQQAEKRRFHGRNMHA